jgi:nicotinamidase-related amidase
MGTALIVTDMLNRYDHEDAERLRESVRTIIDPMRTLLDGAREREMLTVYVNDNHGDWSAGRPELMQYALAGRDRDLVEPIVPAEDLAFIVKARHSVFYETQLDYLLRRSDITRLIIIGQVTEQCILYSALDAYVRHYEVVVPRDAVAHIHPDLADAALQMMQRNMRATITSSTDALG